MKLLIRRFLLLLCAAVAYCSSAAAAPSLSSVEITDRYGLPLRIKLNVHDEYCYPIKLYEASPWLILATIAAEDKRYFEHSGVDFKAVLRAIQQNALAGKTISGASTITQQLVRSLEPRKKNIVSKIGEMFAALKLEKNMDKYEILETYLNRISYSNRIAGVEAASRRYFGLHAQQLSLAQAALLAAIPKSPSKYNPVSNLNPTLERQKSILAKMLELGYITRELYSMALGEKITINKMESPFIAPQFTFMACDSEPESSKIRTTISAEIQTEFQGILKSHTRILKANNVSNAAIVAIDNYTGEILAWVGSADFDNVENGGQIDGVTALRQPGSALKPFVYAMGIDRGLKTSDLLDDSLTYFSGGFQPKNYDETFHGMVRVREALACSYNIPAVRVADMVGVRSVVKGLNKFGFKSLVKPPDFYGLGISLGNGEVTLLELAAGYAMLARGGIYLEPRFSFGQKRSVPRRVMSPQTAYIITDILSDNTARAPAFGLSSPFNMPFPFAAKTGTSKDYRDNWAVGYTPDWTIAVWAGNFSGAAMRKVSGISGAGPILHDAAAYLFSKRPSGKFIRPSGLVNEEICPESGQVAGPFCPGRISEIYKVANRPASTCGIHKTAVVKTPVVPQEGAPRVKFPVNGDVFKVDHSMGASAQRIHLKAAPESMSDKVDWFIDASSVPLVNGWATWRLAPGKHKVWFMETLEGKTRKSKTVEFIVVE